MSKPVSNPANLYPTFTAGEEEISYLPLLKSH
jgi:hypothetical protein